MGEIKRTQNFGLGVPEHFDPSVDKMSENMGIIDSALFKSIPSTLSDLTFNTALETGVYLIKGNSAGTPASTTSDNYAVEVFATNSTHVYQIARSMANSRMHFRYKNGSSSFTSWTTIWNSANDGSGSGLDADLLDGQHGNAYVRNFGKTYSNFNVLSQNGFYQLSNAANSPDSSGGLWGCIVFQTDGIYSTTSYLCQIAIKDNTSGKQLYTRKKNGSVWTSWEKIWTSDTDGSGSGLNADKLDDKHASDFVPCVKSTTSTNIDSITSEGMYEYTSITSSKTLPSFTGDGNTYGLIVKSVKGSSTYNCCFQILLRDDCSYIFMRYFHSNSWSDWEKLNPTPSELLTKIKTVDGSGSGIDADTLDGRHGYGFSTAGTSNSLLTTGTPNSYSSCVSQIYRFYDTGNVIGEGTNKYYGIIQVYNSSSSYMRIAVSFSSGKVYRQSNGASAWSEITPLIPVLTADPSSPSNGQLWIRSDL